MLVFKNLYPSSQDSNMLCFLSGLKFGPIISSKFLSICVLNLFLHMNFVLSEIKMVDVEVDKSKGEIERLKEEIRKLEQTKKGEASSKLEELESQVI